MMVLAELGLRRLVICDAKLLFWEAVLRGAGPGDDL
jgi:hypothetical protein